MKAFIVLLLAAAVFGDGLLDLPGHIEGGVIREEVSIFHSPPVTGYTGIDLVKEVVKHDDIVDEGRYVHDPTGDVEDDVVVDKDRYLLGTTGVVDIVRGDVSRGDHDIVKYNGLTPVSSPLNGLYLNSPPSNYVAGGTYSPNYYYSPTPLHYNAPTPVHYTAPTPVHYTAPTPVHYSPTPLHYTAPTPVHYTAPTPVHYSPTPVRYDVGTPIVKYVGAPAPYYPIHEGHERYELAPVPYLKSYYSEGGKGIERLPLTDSYGVPRTGASVYYAKWQ